MRNTRTKKMERTSARRLMILAATVLILTFGTIAGTIAYITTQTEKVENTFVPAEISTEIDEEFDGTEKTEIVVKNSSDTDVYIRVKLVSYRVDDSGNVIGGKAPIKDFELNENWFEDNGIYYYKLPVAKDAATNDLLAEGKSIVLSQYTDADGGKQVIEVMAEAIQATPKDAVKTAWGESIAAQLADVKK